MPEICPVLRPRNNPNDAPNTKYGVWFYQDEIATYSTEGGGNKMKNWFRERFNTLRAEDYIVQIYMTKEDYDAHFAPNVGNSQVYAEYTVKPEGGRRAWLKERLKEQDPEPKTLRSVKEGAIRSNDAGTQKASMVGWGVDGRKG